MAIGNLCTLTTAAVQHFNVTGVQGISSRGPASAHGAYPRVVKVLGEVTPHAASNCNIVSEDECDRALYKMNGACLMQSLHGNDMTQGSALSREHSACQQCLPQQPAILSLTCGTPSMLAGLETHLTDNGTLNAGISTLTPGYATKPDARSHLTSVINETLLSKCGIGAHADCTAARRFKDKVAPHDLWDFTLSVTSEAVPFVLGLFHLKGFLDTPWQIPAGEPGELVPGVPTIRFLRQPIPQESLGFYRVQPPKLRSAHILPSCKIAVYASLMAATLPKAWLPQHVILLGSLLKQNAGTIAHLECTCINLMTTQATTNDSSNVSAPRHAQVPVHLTMDIQDPLLQVPPQSNHATCIEALLGEYTIELVRVAQDAGDLETFLIAPSARLVEHYDLFGHSYGSTCHTGHTLRQSQCVHYPCQELHHDNTDTCSKPRGSHAHCNAMLATYGHHINGLNWTHRTPAMMTVTELLVKELLVTLGGIGIEVAGRFTMSLTVAGAEEPRLQHGLAFTLPVAGFAWHAPVMNAVFVRLAEAVAAFCTQLRLAPLTLYLHCDRGTCPSILWHHTIWLTQYSYQRVGSQYTGRQHDRGHNLKLPSSYMCTVTCLQGLGIHASSTAICCNRKPKADPTLAGDFLPITAEAFADPNSGEYRRALYLVAGTPLARLSEDILARVQPATGSVFVLGLARPVDQAIALMACALAGGLPIVGGSTRLTLGTCRYSRVGQSCTFRSLDDDWGNALPWIIGILRRDTRPFDGIRDLPEDERVELSMMVPGAIMTAEPPVREALADPPPPAARGMMALVFARQDDRLSPSKVENSSRILLYVGPLITYTRSSSTCQSYMDNYDRTPWTPKSTFVFVTLNTPKWPPDVALRYLHYTRVMQFDKRMIDVCRETSRTENVKVLHAEQSEWST